MKYSVVYLFILTFVYPVVYTYREEKREAKNQYDAKRHERTHSKPRRPNSIRTVTVDLT